MGANDWYDPYPYSRGDAWSPASVLACFPAAVAIGTVMGTWMNCAGNPRGFLVFAAVAVLAWFANAATFAVVRYRTMRNRRWRRNSFIVALVAMGLVAVPTTLLASAVEQWQIGLLHDAGITGPECGTVGEPYDYVT